MQKIARILTLGTLLAALLLMPVNSALGKVGPEALKNCQDFAFSLEEEFVTQGPTPPDGNPIISDGDLLGKCVVCARNGDLLAKFDIQVDIGLDAVDIIDVDRYLVVFSTELDSPYPGQFTAGDLLTTHGAVIPNISLLYKFNIPKADLGFDAVQMVGLHEQIINFLNFAATVPREQWLAAPEKLSAMLEEYGIDIWFSTEGTGPLPMRPLFLDGDLLSARFGVIVKDNSTLLPPSVPAGIPLRGVDFGLDGFTGAHMEPGLPYFSTELLFQGNPSFTDGDLLITGNGVGVTNYEMVLCFEPKATFLGLDAVYKVIPQPQSVELLAQLQEDAALSAAPSAGTDGDPAAMQEIAAVAGIGLQLEPCREMAFSTEEDFVTPGPEPPDGNPIISDGDLLGRDCTVCARNKDLLLNFDVSLDLGLDAVDIISVDKKLVAFSTELDSPNPGQFTAGDLLATNGAIIPNSALLWLFQINYDLGLDALFFVGDPEAMIFFFDEVFKLGRDHFVSNPGTLVDMLRQYKLDIWFSTEGTGPLPIRPLFLDGDLLSVESGTVVAGNDILLPATVPAGIPTRGVDFGLDAVAGHRNSNLDYRLELLNFSTEILFQDGPPLFTDGDILKFGNGVVTTNQELLPCLKDDSFVLDLGLDALSRSCMPELEWTWNSTLVEPNFTQVMMAPVAADLNNDKIPEVIFSTFSPALGWQGGGILRAISGNGGSELFSVTSPNYRVNAGAEPAVGDIDNDGRPEIVVSKDSGHLICFEHDGSLKWISNDVVGRTAVSIADLDEDGIPEIIAGRTVLNNDGTTRWTGAAASSYTSTVANLDLVGHPEVVTGGAAYRHDGTLYWSTLPGGQPAIGNFDDDPYPEIVVVGGNQVTLKEHDGTIKWGPIAMPSGGNGPPVVADVDGDGWPEIGVGGYDHYVVFETDGSIKWTAEIQDHSSRAASSTAFDFGRDGSFEIVYSDELKLRIYKGNNGAVLFEAPSPSGTLMEHPIILDVDNDGHVEIVAPVNNYAHAGNTGIEVYGNDECWPGARKIWNQHTYHITNINENATVPVTETNNWEIFNNFRAQAPPEICECDLDSSGACNLLDYFIFGQDYGRTDCHDPGVECECDLNDDGACNLLDYFLFGQDYGRTDCPVIEVSECAPQVCGQYTFDCNPDDSNCLCVLTAEGGGTCSRDQACPPTEECQTSADCANGEVCAVQTCCGFNICIADTCVSPTGANQGMSVIDGPTASSR